MLIYVNHCKALLIFFNVCWFKSIYNKPMIFNCIECDFIYFISNGAWNKFFERFVDFNVDLKGSIGAMQKV